MPTKVRRRVLEIAARPCEEFVSCTRIRFAESSSLTRGLDLVERPYWASGADVSLPIDRESLPRLSTVEVSIALLSLLWWSDS
jgi:hypothetical protein